MIGKTLGHYRVGEQLGRGGMGEVYVAEDLNLNRKVALKFLPDAFTGDPERMARFEREAKVLASLNHTNIAAIHGLEQAEGKRFIVMELVEGETLAQRLGKGALPVDEALGICMQIVEGLEAAHEKGVIHRDLKPANVMITEGDKAKILDFGLAKALSDETQSADASQSPTLTEAMTRPGVILGTAAYMSPEQAKGKAVDRRADIWAFGCILYECLTGKRTFEGETVTETLAAILKGEPDWQAFPSTISPNINFVLRRCLEKEKNRRLRDAADIRIALEEPCAAPPESKSIRPPRSRALIVALVAAGMIIGLGLADLWYQSTGASEVTAHPTYSHIAAPPGTISAFHHGFALSPDGQILVFSARTADGRRQLWKRRLENPRALPITGTDDGFYPFWSPDGRQIAFYASGALRRAPAEGGQVQTICAAAGFTVGSWGDNNEILFSALGAPGIFRVSANGGTPSKVLNLGDENVYYPQWLPGGRYFLFCRSKSIRLGYLFAASAVNNVPPKQILEFDTGAVSGAPAFRFSPPGYLFYNQAGALSVQRFDTKSLSATGRAVAIAGVAGTPGMSFALAAALNEVLMCARESAEDIGNPGDPLARLKWIDRLGEIVGELGPPGRYWTLRLSPDGLYAAANPSDDIWVYGTGNRISRLTSESAGRMAAVWSPDGTRLAYSAENRMEGLLVKSANQGGQETELPNSKGCGSLSDWSPNGRYLLVNGGMPQSGGDILLYDLNEKSIKPWLATKFDEGEARFSSDGNWVAYTTNANGRQEVYVRLFKGEGAAVAVSPGGGRHSAWRRDGRELYYLNAKDELMAVSVTNLGATLQIGEPKRLFKAVINDVTDDFSPYDVTPDGQRFLVNTPEPPEPLLFIQGIEQLLKKGQ